MTRRTAGRVLAGFTALALLTLIKITVSAADGTAASGAYAEGTPVHMNGIPGTDAHAYLVGDTVRDVDLVANGIQGSGA